ncbi:proline-rich extensin-like protein EPR1 isoform X1 [Folsomia candida]|uniref:Uncharacterized protein n=1 Tax=Folsomia candida TaxID=158441 RepID=A0A226ECL8_FOLCA|nr:proline-rich extensin-like protein EPR1 isoform X1 [Folsomia candida]OXA55325.1 hypothetical protein Fcan01_10073 [Folsomia candida]
MRLLLAFLVLCGSVLIVSGVGFRFQSDKKSGEKRLWLHVPGSDPNLLTDFEEKPYNGPKNLVDVNRPISSGKTKLSRPRTSKLSSEVEEVTSSNPIRRKTGSKGRSEKFQLPILVPIYEDGYHYPKPNTPFVLPPQVGYPDVPDEENFGIGQNSEENKDIFAGRPGYVTTPRPAPITTPNDDAAEQFKSRPKSTPSSPVFCKDDSEIGYGRPQPANCIPKQPDSDDAAERFKPRPKPATPASPVYCPTETEIAHGKPRPPNCLPRDGYYYPKPDKRFGLPQTTKRPDDSDAAEVFKPRPKPTTPSSPVLCPTEAEIAYGRPRPANCIPRPTTRPPTTTPSDDAAEVFKPRPKPTTPPAPQLCPTDSEVAYGRPRPANCIPRPTTRPPTTTTPDSDAAEVFKPRPKPTTTKPPQLCPTDSEIAYGRPKPPNCIPRATTRPTEPPLCPEEGMDGFYRPRPHNCRPRPTTKPPDSDAAEVFKPRPKPTTPPAPQLCPTESEIAYGKPRPANCIPRPTTRPPTTTPADDAAEVFKPRPKPTTPPPRQLCPTESEIAYGRPRPANCIPRTTTRPPTTPPDADDAAEVFKPRPKPTTPPPRQLCPTESEIAYGRPRPANCIPRPTTRPPTTTTPDSDAAEVFKPRPKPTTTKPPRFCPTEAEIADGWPLPPNCIPRPPPTIPPLCPEEGMDGFYRPRHFNCRPRPTTRPQTTTPRDADDAAEVFKPRPKPTTPPAPQLCPTDREIAYGKPRPANCIPRPTTRPPTTTPADDAAEVFKPRPKPTARPTPLPFCPGRGDAPRPRTDQPIKCRPRPTTTTKRPDDDDAAEVFKPRPKPTTPSSPQYCPSEYEISQGRPRPANCIPRPTRRPQEPDSTYIPPYAPPPPQSEGCGYGYDPCPGQQPIRPPTYGWGPRAPPIQTLPPRYTLHNGPANCGPGFAFPCGNRPVPNSGGRSTHQGGHNFPPFGGTRQIGFLRSGSRNQSYRPIQNEFDHNRGFAQSQGPSRRGNRHLQPVSTTTTVRQTTGGTVIYVSNHSGRRPGSSQSNLYGSSFSRSRPNTANFYTI